MSEPGEMAGNFSNSTEEQLEDFEVFDLRDAMNVGAYSLMSASKENHSLLELQIFIFDIIQSASFPKSLLRILKDDLFLIKLFSSQMSNNRKPLHDFCTARLQKGFKMTLISPWLPSKVDRKR